VTQLAAASSVGGISAIVASLARPGGNITGVSNFLPSTSAKLIELLKAVAPNLARFCVLHNPENAGKMLELQELKIGGQASGVTIEPIEARSAEDLERLLSTRSHFSCDALITLQEALSFAYRKRIAEFAAQNQLATIFQIRALAQPAGRSCPGKKKGSGPPPRSRWRRSSMIAQADRSMCSRLENKARSNRRRLRNRRQIREQLGMIPHDFQNILWLDVRVDIEGRF
jgi:hypothetical protein